jgi:uncharacterized protein (TIGR03086 family)
VSAVAASGTEEDEERALLASLAQTFDHASSIVAGVAEDQIAVATPCPAWDVQTLLGHMTGVIVNMGRGASGRELLGAVDCPLDDDRGGRFRSEVDQTLAAWSARGLNGDVDVGGGPMPARMAIGINLTDTAAHSWDLARATGQDEELPDELAPLILGICTGFLTDDLRDVIGFDAAVPVDADATGTAKLVAFLGRRP